MVEMQEKMRNEKIQKDVNTEIEYIILLTACGILILWQSAQISSLIQVLTNRPQPLPFYIISKVAFRLGDTNGSLILYKVFSDRKHALVIFLVNV